MRLSVAFRKREFITRSLKATASQRIEISRKEQKEQKNNKVTLIKNSSFLTGL
jgi:hypothetical protein